MKTRLASVRADGGLDRVDRAVQLLEEEWRRHGEVQLENFWAEQDRTGAAGPVDSLGFLAALVKADLRLRYDQGQTPTAAGYLQRFPELRDSDSRVLSLVYEEYCLSEERGSAPDVDSFCDRYPEWKSSLASQLRYHRFFSQAAGVSPSLPRFPKPGENFEEFHLLSLLGKGGTSCVFLARDLSLGGKQVALKVTLDRTQEPKVQGVLDHPHIVPVNSVIYQAKGELCGLSMPFRPGLPLDEIIRRLKPAEQPRTALAFWQVLTDNSEGGSSRLVQHGTGATYHDGGRAGPRGDGWEGFPLRGTYAQGAAWIVMILARALHYAHGMRTFHRDVKPANVLLTLLNGPQLLDFNLAESPHSADHARAALHGGTLPYMAPEQIEAFLNPELWGKVGAEADIYSLGLVLRELLTGQRPELPVATPDPSRAMRDLLDRRPFLDVAVRRFNPAIPHSLAAIVAKCLALSPNDRYSSAESLARDLDRFLNHQPLLDAPNPSRRERVTNWVTRQRRMLKLAACIMVVGVLASAVLASGILVSGFLPSRAINQPLKPSFETSPMFQAAVRSVELGEYQQAVDPLRKLVKDEPDSCLIKLYLSFALDGKQATEDLEEAEQALREALAAPKTERILADWAVKHRSVAVHLSRFADSMIERVDQDAERYDIDNPRADEVRDKRLKRPSYKLARDALRHAEKLDPNSQEIQRLLAMTEGILGDFETAYNRLSRLIASGASGSNNRDMLFFCHDLRGRAAFLWAESLRKKGGSLDKETLSRLKQASKDLNWCDNYLMGHKYTDQELKEYHVMHDRVRLTLTMAEVETDLAHLPRAIGYLEECKKLIVMLMNQTAHAKSRNLRVPDPTELNERMTAASNRLKDLGSAGGPDSNISSNPSGKSAPHSG